MPNDSTIESMIGTTLAGYRIEHLIACGGVSTVWEVCDERGARRILKLLNPAVRAVHPELDERLRREGELAGRVRGPGVVQVVEQGLWGGEPFLIMERAPGETLYRRARRRPLPLNTVRGIVDALAWTLMRLHAAGIVHRDIKPSNIAIDGYCEPRVTLLDFGLAKSVARDGEGPELTCMGTALGSPPYMSPEQFLDAHSVDHHADSWSLAAVTYFMLTGKAPFGNRGRGHIARRVMASDYVPVSKLRKDISPTIDAWFERAFSLDPAERFGSAAELAAAFADVEPRPLSGPSLFDRRATLIDDEPHVHWDAPTAPDANAPALSRRPRSRHRHHWSKRRLPAHTRSPHRSDFDCVKLRPRGR